MTADAAIDYETDDTSPPPAPPASAPASPATAARRSVGDPPLVKNPWLAGFFSLFPGLGHIYNGLYLRGVTFFLVIAGLIQLADTGHDLFAFVLAFAWAFQVLDAYRQATLINLGYASDLGLADRPRRPTAGEGMAAVGAILFGIGFLAALDRFFRIDLEWLVELWPFGFMALGGWLVARALVARRAAATADPDEI